MLPTKYNPVYFHHLCTANKQSKLLFGTPGRHFTKVHFCRSGAEKRKSSQNDALFRYLHFLINVDQQNGQNSGDYNMYRPVVTGDVFSLINK
jgi:hypothetical protein